MKLQVYKIMSNLCALCTRQQAVNPIAIIIDFGLIDVIRVNWILIHRCRGPCYAP